MAQRSSRKKRDEYAETPDWATAFQRADNKPPRPGFTGEGVISEDTLNEILKEDGKIQISIWTLDRDGKPLRNRDGTRRFRIHIEPPYDDAADENQDDDDRDDGDIPF